MSKQAPPRFRPRLERVEERSLLSGALAAVAPHAMSSLATADHMTAAATAARNHEAAMHTVRVAHLLQQARHQHPVGCTCGCNSKGGGKGVGSPPFNCARVGIYNFALVTVTNISNAKVNFSVLAYPCPNTFVGESLNPGGTLVFYTHFPSNLSPSFLFNLGGLNSYTAKPNIIANKMYPQFVYQITPNIGSQYQIVQTSPGIFALQPAS